MIASSDNERRYGLTASRAAGIIISCALVFMALLALVPDA
jgi:hypothetical protein